MGTKTIALFVVALATMMCGAQSQSRNTIAEKCEVPSDAAAKPNPESEKAEARTTGRKMFIRTCARCHEEDGSGRSQGAANLRCPQVQSQTDGALFWKISNGNIKAGMVGKVVYNDRGRPLDSGELQELLPGCDGFIAGLDCIDNAALASADRLRVIARYGVGVDNIDLDAAAKRKITVTNTPHANATSVAELTIALLLALARSIPESVEAVREGEWPRLHVLAGGEGSRKI